MGYWKQAPPISAKATRRVASATSLETLAAKIAPRDQKLPITTPVRIVPANAVFERRYKRAKSNLGGCNEFGGCVSESPSGTIDRE